jgi:S1-C subfamily serine protease
MIKNQFSLLSDALADVVASGAGATVLVNGRNRMPASGIAYQADLVLTADHVVERDEDILIVTPEGEQLKATLAGRDPGSDLALLRLEKPALKPAGVSKVEPRVGQLTLALARPSLEGVQASMGIISAIGGPVRNSRGGLLNRYLQAEVNPLPGFSGGPLLDAESQVLGLNTSGLAGGLLITIPVSTAWSVGEILAKHGRIRRGYLGIRSQSAKVPESVQESLGSRQEYGLLLVGIEESGPAEAAGLMVGDMITAINGNRVCDPDDLWVQLSGDVVDSSIPVEVLRGGQKMTIAVKIAERK